MEKLDQHIEALIFVSESAISIGEIRNTLETHLEVKVSKESIEEVFDRLIEKYNAPEFAIEIIEISNGYQFMTKGAYHNVVGTYLKEKNNKKLTKSALETLSIIAYRQPIMKSQMEELRGVNCDYAVQKLLEKDLVEIVGRSEGPGKPLLYGTSQRFMDYFGMKNIHDLPKIKEIAPEVNSIGEEGVDYVIHNKTEEE